MDSCFTCKEYLDCSIRMGCNLVGCVGYKPIDNLNGEINKDNINNMEEMSSKYSISLSNL